MHKREKSEKINSSILQRYLDQSQNAVTKSDFTYSKVKNTGRKISESDDEGKSEQCKEVKISIIDEYKAHLKLMSKFNHFN